MLNESMIAFGNMEENRLGTIEFTNGIRFVWEPYPGGWFIFVEPRKVSKTYSTKHECLRRYNSDSVEWL